ETPLGIPPPPTMGATSSRPAAPPATSVPPPTFVFELRDIVQEIGSSESEKEDVVEFGSEGDEEDASTSSIISLLGLGNV
ncbi:unnamed protein product, partial [Ilex paraguariensis]